MMCGQPLLDFFFPVGRTIETASADDNPNVKYNSNGLKSTWLLTHIGRCPVGIDTNDSDFNVVGKQIGEKKHKLTIDEMPTHNHIMNSVRSWIGDGNVSWVAECGGTSAVENRATSNTGGDQEHNNIQPSEVAYFWKRTT